MLTYEKLSKKPGTFGRLTGVSVGIFSEMAEKVGPLWEKRRNNYDMGGRNHALPGVENHLLAMLIYYRCYVTYEFIGFFFDCDETTVMRAVKRIEKMAIRVIHIEKKREVSASDTEYLIIDATEQPVQRPKKKQRKSYSGKKKGHTRKRNISRIRKEKSARFPEHTPGKPMISPYTESRRRETVFAGFRKRPTTDTRGYGNMTNMPKFLIKSPGAES